MFRSASCIWRRKSRKTEPAGRKGKTGMDLYTHRIAYYETDRMGVAHHSNYIRWMEEARVDFLERIGWPYGKMEELGVLSPVIAVNCEYKKSTTFDDLVSIRVTVREARPVKTVIGYVMTNAKTGELVAVGESSHCYLNREGRPLSLKRALPDFLEKLQSLAEEKL